MERGWVRIFVVVLGAVALGCGESATSDVLALRGALETAGRQQEIMVRVPQFAACTFQPAGSTDMLAMDSDDRGVVHFFVDPIDAVASAPDGRMSCKGPSGVEEMIINFPSLLDQQAEIRASIPPRTGGKVRPALEGDPDSYGTDELVSMRYPPRPDRERHPAAYAKWREMVTKPITMYSPPTIAHPEISRSLSYANDPAWSGVAIHQSSTTYVEAEGSWVVPTEYNSNSTGYSSLWVGLDGVVTPGHLTVVQCGTEQSNIYQGGYNYSEYYAWYEWYPNPSHHFASIDSYPGDHIFAQVFVGNSDQDWTVNGDYGWFYIYDSDQGYGYFESDTKPTGKTFYGKSAEWVMERPSTGNPPVPFPLANYSYAKIVDHLAYTSSFSGRDLTTDNGTLFTMRLPASPYTILSGSYVDSSNDINFQWYAAQ